MKPPEFKNPFEDQTPTVEVHKVTCPACLGKGTVQLQRLDGPPIAAAVEFCRYCRSEKFCLVTKQELADGGIYSLTIRGERDKNSPFVRFDRNLITRWEVNGILAGIRSEREVAFE